MKLKTLGLAVAASLAVISTGASATVVGGINFTPTANGTHFENTTVYETVVNQAGDILKGYGQVTSVNGVGNYGANAYSLYFTFEYKVDSITPTLVQFSAGTMSIYRLAQDALNFTTLTPAAAMAGITGGTKWLQLEGHSNVATGTPFGQAVNAGTELFGEGSVVGTQLSFSGRGLADVVAGWGIAGVETFLDTDKVNDVAGGKADIELSSTGTSFGAAPGARCTPVTIQTQNGPIQVLPTGQYCISGSTNLKGYVPEPSSIALLGLGLLGAFGAGRRRKAA